MIIFEKLKYKILNIDKKIIEPLHFGGVYLLLFRMYDSKSEYMKFVLYGTQKRKGMILLKFYSVDNKKQKVKIWSGCVGTYYMVFAGKDVDGAYKHYSNLLEKGNSLENAEGFSYRINFMK